MLRWYRDVCVRQITAGNPFSLFQRSDLGRYNDSMGMCSTRWRRRKNEIYGFSFEFDRTYGRRTQWMRAAEVRSAGLYSFVAAITHKTSASCSSTAVFVVCFDLPVVLFDTKNSVNIVGRRHRINYFPSFLCLLSLSNVLIDIISVHNVNCQWSLPGLWHNKNEMRRA